MDRTADRHSSLIIYEKEGLHYHRRHDFEPNNIECIWIELNNNDNHKHTLFGLYCRPPNTDTIFYSTVEDTLN